jgi:peptidoglycan lytic transglycosylase D
VTRGTEAAGFVGRRSAAAEARSPGRRPACGWLAAVLAGLCALPLAAQASHPLDPALFPVPAVLAGNVAFWTDVFTRYDSHRVLLHDEVHPERVYTVLDFSALDASDLSEVAKRRRRGDALRDATERCRTLLLALARGEDGGRPEEAARVAAMFAGAAGGAGEYLRAADGIRTQTGLADRFAEAVGVSGRYLPGMEKIFAARDLPRDLTRLPFVESMFQVRAISKAAAGGVWQITPTAGRGYLTIGLDVDERYDPLLATEAAATVLEENHRDLGTWPLAITAYNYGKNGVARAVAALGTRDLGVIVTLHQGRSFGFASKNFYAEFLAAATVYNDRARYFPDTIPAPPLAFAEFAPDRYVPVKELAREASVDLDDLRGMNPAVAGEVWSGRLLLPAGYRLRVPPGAAATFQTAYAALPDHLKAGRQAGFRYRVEPGDTLSGIAKRYGTSVRALAEANHLGHKDLLRVGQSLYVPPGKGGRGGPGAAATAGGVHVVRLGETLWSIARRYGTSVEALERANGLTGSHRIYPGQRLTVSR